MSRAEEGVGRCLDFSVACLSYRGAIEAQASSRLLEEGEVAGMNRGSRLSTIEITATGGYGSRYNLDEVSSGRYLFGKPASGQNVETDNSRHAIPPHTLRAQPALLLQNGAKVIR